jgi:hypothetical protein
MKSCIIILTHPNTDNKLKILSDSLSRLSKSNYPIFVFANMYVNPEYLVNATDFIFTGENKLISASDVLSLEKVREARELTKYRFYLNFSDYTITYFPINYGVEKSYYWACINLHKVAFNYVNDKGYTHFMFMQYDSLIDDVDLPLVEKNINDTVEYNYDANFAVDPEMGDNHINGDVFFGKVKWFSDMTNTMSINDFYGSTFPNWTPEEYFYIKLKEKGGRVKIKIKNIDNPKQYYSNVPDTWEKEYVNNESNRPINMYFPNVSENGLSSYLDTSNFDVDKSLIVSLLLKENYYELFIFNRVSSLNPKTINVYIKIKRGDDILFETITDLEPGQWNIKHINDDLRGSNLELVTKYIVEDKKNYLI